MCRSQRDLFLCCETVWVGHGNPVVFIGLRLIELSAGELKGRVLDEPLRTRYGVHWSEINSRKLDQERLLSRRIVTTILDAPVILQLNGDRCGTRGTCHRRERQHADGRNARLYGK